MYPDFQFLFSSLMGSEAPGWLSLFKTFGFFVALAFLSGTFILYQELKRKEKQGLLHPKLVTEIVGKPASTMDYVWSGLIGFVLLYKIGGLFSDYAIAAADPMTYFISLKGNFLAGLIGLAVSVYLKYAEKKKTVLPKPQEKKYLLWPHQRISEIIMIAAIGGIVGAKLFNALETWDQFIQDPIGSLISSSGLTFYGGLITATLLLWRFAKRNNISIAHLFDAAAPALILAYGVGRLGCHFSGDGDWGIFNSAYVSEANGNLGLLPEERVNSTLALYQDYFKQEHSRVENVPHLYKPAPAGLPRWWFAMNYAHNVNNDGIKIADCYGHYCAMLPVAVFPTSLYEFVMCLLLFGILWAVRKRFTWPLHLFGLYLIFNGLERFFIEKIRVNYKYDWGFLHPTQAEIISTILVLCGVLILAFYKKQSTLTAPTQQS